MFVALFLDVLFVSSVCFCDAYDIQVFCDLGEVGVLDFGVVATFGVGVNINGSKFEASCFVHVECSVPCYCGGGT